VAIAKPFEVDVDAILALPTQEARDDAWARVSLLKAKVEENRLWQFRPHGGEQEWKRNHGQALNGTESRGQVEYLEINKIGDGGLYIGAAVAGNRFGKTEIAMVDNAVQILPPDFVPPWLEQYRRREYVGDFKCRTVAVDLRTLQRVHLPKLRNLVPPAALWGGNFKKAWNDRYSTLTFEDGSTWAFLTHDMEVDAFAGDDLDRAHFDEEPPGEKGKRQFEETEVRLADRDGDLRFTMTPLLGLNWLYGELSRNDKPRDDAECKVITGSMEHNPHLSEKAKERLVKRWAKKPLTLAARMHGRWVHFEGLIYDEFRNQPRGDGGHIVPSRAIPRAGGRKTGKPTVEIYGAIDPGLDHPAGLLFAWLDSNDTLEVFYAEKRQGEILAELAARYHGVCEEWGFRPRWTVIDPSSRNRNFETGRNAEQVLRDLGVNTIPGQNAHVPGFDAIKERLRTDRLAIQADCEELVDEFQNYRWKTKRNAQTDDVSPQQPIKKNDDLLDPLRYLVMSMPVKGEGDRDPNEDVTPAQAALNHALKRLGSRSRVIRVGARV
jgi:hypothetical protein